MAVESPNRSTISPLRFFNRTARVNQQGPALVKERLTQIDGSLKRILSIKEKTIDTSRLEDEESRRVEKEKKLESGKFFVKGVGKLANAIPGKNTIQRFLLFKNYICNFEPLRKHICITNNFNKSKCFKYSNKSGTENFGLGHFGFSSRRFFLKKNPLYATCLTE